MPTTYVARDFEAYSTTHLVALAVFLVGVVVIVAVGRRHRDQDVAVPFSRGFALAICVFTVPLQVLQLLPADWNPRTSLPFQLCDLAWMAAVYALWTHRDWAVGLTYFWGLTLTTQGIITPALDQDWPSPRYVMFWGMHLLIVWAAIYLVWGLRLTPTWAVYRKAVAITTTWAVAVFTYNAIAGTNYGYLNRKPSTASILDYLGPWPLYVVLEIAIVVAAWALLTWPWSRARSRDARSTTGEGPRVWAAGQRSRQTPS